MKHATIYSEAWCNQVFEQKNKRYGAYKLRVESAGRTRMAMLISGCLLFAVLLTPLLFELISGSAIPKSGPIENWLTYDLTPVERVPVITEPEPMARHERTAAPKAVPSFTGQMEQDLHRNPGQNASPVTSGNLAADSLTDADPVENTLFSDSISEDNHEYPPAGIEINPEFPGGEKMLFRFLYDRIRYPESAYRENRTGVIYVSFLIDKTGRVGDIRIVKDIAEERAFATEVIRVISQMPDWKPGKQNGKPVFVRYTIPVNFQIKNGF